MAIRSIRVVITLGTLFLLIPLTLIAQGQRDVAPLRSWSAPLFWQPSQAESKAAFVRQMLAGNFRNENASFDITTDAQTPANSLVFVGMTPCRVVDTRPDQGFPSPFGAPNLAGGATRTFPVQSSTRCSIPSIAQAYSLNVPVAPVAFPQYITVRP